MSVTTDRSDTFVTEVEHVQMISGVVHEWNEESSETGVYMNRDSIFLS